MTRNKDESKRKKREEESGSEEHEEEEGRRQRRGRITSGKDNKARNGAKMIDRRKGRLAGGREMSTPKEGLRRARRVLIYSLRGLLEAPEGRIKNTSKVKVLCAVVGYVPP